MLACPKYLRGKWTLARGAPVPVKDRRVAAPPPLRRYGDGALALPALFRGSWIYTTVSREDAWACAVNWFVKPDGYVCCNLTSYDRQIQAYLHRLVVARRDHPDAEAFELALITKLVDHKDREKLHNTRRNLRVASQSEQNVNQTRNLDALGIVWIESRNRWRVVVKRDGKSNHVGHFRFEQQAVAARARYLRQLELCQPTPKRSEGPSPARSNSGDHAPLNGILIP